MSAKIKYDHANHEPCKSEPHAGQELMTVDGFSFHADKEMIPLLTALNNAGLQTYSHCAGHEHEGGAYTPSWVVLELPKGVNVEIRHHLGRSQMLLRWEPSWHKEKLECIFENCEAPDECSKSGKCQHVT